MEENLTRFCCQNAECPDYGKRDTGNLSVCDHYGPNKQRRMLRCSTCTARFSERKGTPLFRALLPEAKIVSVLAHISESCGVRKTSRLTGVNKDTVVRYSLLAGEHAKDLHDELVAFSPSNPGGAVRRKMVLRGQEGSPL
jgi:LacI family transcriptional regulator